MKYNWELCQIRGRLIVTRAYAKGVGSNNYYTREFKIQDMGMLIWLVRELTNTPKGMGLHKIKEAQHRLGEIVWEKLGDRAGDNNSHKT